MAPEVIQNSDGYNEKVSLETLFWIFSFGSFDLCCCSCTLKPTPHFPFSPQFLCVSLLRPWTLSHWHPFLDAGRYLVTGDNCNWNGQRGTSTRRSSPYESAFYHTSRKSTTGYLITHLIILGKECRILMFFAWWKHHSSYFRRIMICVFCAAGWALFPFYERICLVVFEESSCRGK